MLRKLSSQSFRALGFYESLKQTTLINGNRLMFKDSKTIKCWKCGAQKAEQLFCEKCSVLQEPDENLTYFDVIGVKKSYDIKTAELTKKFRKLQNLLHPDRFGGKDKEELAVSETYSSLVNEAYSTLLSPMERGLYLLRLEGLSIAEGAVQAEPAFLAEVMELNEQLEEAADQEAVARIAADNQERLDALTRQIDAAFREKDLEKAKQLLTKMKYFWSLEGKIKELKQKMGIVS